MMSDIKINLKEFNTKFSHVPKDIKKIVRAKIKSGEFNPQEIKLDKK